MRWVVFAGLLLCAVACYLIGSVKGAGIFLIAGVLFELAGWIGLIRFNRKPRV